MLSSRYRLRKELFEEKLSENGNKGERYTDIPLLSVVMFRLLYSLLASCASHIFFSPHKGTFYSELKLSFHMVQRIFYLFLSLSLSGNIMTLDTSRQEILFLTKNSATSRSCPLQVGRNSGDRSPLIRI